MARSTGHRWHFAFIDLREGEVMGGGGRPESAQKAFDLVTFNEERPALSTLQALNFLKQGYLVLRI